MGRPAVAMRGQEEHCRGGALAAFAVHQELGLVLRQMPRRVVRPACTDVAIGSCRAGYTTTSHADVCACWRHVPLASASSTGAAGALRKAAFSLLRASEIPPGYDRARKIRRL